jgi:hypothetical protein
MTSLLLAKRFDEEKKLNDEDPAGPSRTEELALRLGRAQG